MELLMWLLVGALLGFVASQKTGDHPVKGILIGARLGPLALLMLLAKPASGQSARRPCPHCRTPIPADATVCPQCRRDIPRAATPPGYGSPRR